MKIIDCITFFDELDILEWRLHELDAVVDHFVIVESRETHGSENVKPLNLRDNWSRFEKFHDKISCFMLSHLFPSYTGSQSGWARENFQRECIATALRNGTKLSDTDIVIISDCDEIPRARVIANNIDRIQSGPHQLCMDFFYYNVNSYMKQWARSTVSTYGALLTEGGPQRMRDAAGGNGAGMGGKYPHLADAGWHFSYFGDVKRMRNKTACFAHSEDAPQKEFLRRTDEQIACDVYNKVNIFGDASMSIRERRSSEDPRLPAYFLENRERFKQYTDGR